MEELLSLKWNNHKSSFFDVLANLRGTEQYSDVILACDGRMFNAHRIVLSTCSEYFSNIFKEIGDKNLVIVLRDIGCQDLEALLDYMYLGEVNVKQSELSSLIKVAECLQLKGLAVPDINANDPVESSPTVKRQAEPSMRPKKKKKNSPSIELKPEVQTKVHTIDESSNNNLTDVKKEDEAIDIEDFTCDQSLTEQNDVFNYNENQTESQKCEPNTDDSQPGTSFKLESQLWREEEQSDTSGRGSFTQFNYPVEDFDSSQFPDDQGMDSSYPPKKICPFCQKGFSSMRSVRRHVNIHVGYKPFKCTLCQYTSSRADTLLRHMNLRHLNSTKVPNMPGKPIG